MADVEHPRNSSINERDRQRTRLNQPWSLIAKEVMALRCAVQVAAGSQRLIG
jgi:hypothetical protein